MNIVEDTRADANTMAGTCTGAEAIASAGAGRGGHKCDGRGRVW